MRKDSRPAPVFNENYGSFSAAFVEGDPFTLFVAGAIVFLVGIFGLLLFV